MMYTAKLKVSQGKPRTHRGKKSRRIQRIHLHGNKETPKPEYVSSEPRFQIPGMSGDFHGVLIEECIYIRSHGSRL